MHIIALLFWAINIIRYFRTRPGTPSPSACTSCTCEVLYRKSSRQPWVSHFTTLCKSTMARLWSQKAYDCFLHIGYWIFIHRQLTSFLQCLLDNLRAVFPPHVFQRRQDSIRGIATLVYRVPFGKDCHCRVLGKRPVAYVLAAEAETYGEVSPVVIVLGIEKFGDVTWPFWRICDRLVNEFAKQMYKY